MAEDVRLSPTRLVLAGLIGVLVMASAIGWRVIYASPVVIVVVAGSSVLGVLVAVVSRHRRIPGVVALGVAVVAGMAMSALGDPSNALEAGSGMVRGWKDLATTGLLAGSTPVLLMPPAITSSVAAFASTRLSWSQSRRALALGVALVPAVVAYAYSSDVSEYPFWMAGLLVALSGLILLVDRGALPDGVAFSDNTSGMALQRRSLVVGAVLVFASSMLALVTVPVVRGAGGGSAPFSLRTWIERQVLEVEDTSPLAMVKAQKVAASPDLVFEIEVDGLVEGQEIALIPVAVLDKYDGSVFSTAGGFTPAGVKLPSAAGAVRGETGATLTQTVVLAPSYPYRVLPLVGELIEVPTSGLLWNRSTRTLASLEGISTFTAELGSNDPALHEDDTLGEVPGRLSHALDLPSIGVDQFAVIDSFVTANVSGPEYNAGSILALNSALRSSGFGYNENAPGGHSLAALASYLAEPEDGSGSRVGFAEQSAGALAVGARRLGIASRVVVGYQLEAPLSRGEPKALVFENMAHAWVEIWTVEGWARVDPTNPENAVSTLVDREPTVAEEADGAESAIPEAVAPPILDPSLARPDSSIALLVGVILLLALLGVPVMVLIAKRVRRRRRRSASDASTRAIGARNELADGLSDLGLGSGDSETLIDLSERLDLMDLDRSPGALVRMASVLDEALYSHEGACEQGADESWDHFSTVMAEVSPMASRAKRMTRSVNPRTLIRR